MTVETLKKMLHHVLATPSIARNLASRLALVFAGVFGLCALVFTTISVKRENNRQRDRADDAVRDLVGVLAVPLWTYNIGEVKNIIRPISMSEDIAGIRVYDDERKEVARINDTKASVSFTRKAEVKRKNRVIGYVEVDISQDAAVARQMQMWGFTVVVLILLLAASIVSSALLLEKHLNLPMARLIKGLKRIARGQYDERLPDAAEAELAAIGKAFARMADKLSKREKTLAEAVQARTIYDTELVLAQTIQQSMIEQCRKSRSLEIIPFYEPARNVSGDWFSTFESPDRRHTYIVMGDVSGHGVPQALITASVMATTRCLDRTIRQQESSLLPSEITDLIRETTAFVMQQGRLAMTMLALRIDHNTNSLLLCNAGHTFPLLISPEVNGAKVRELARTQQAPIGFDIDAPPSYVDQTFFFEPSDFLCVYTDGLSSSRDTSGRPFHRTLIRALKELPFDDLNFLHEFIVNQWRQHGATDAVADDICLLSIGLGGKAQLDKKVG